MARYVVDLSAKAIVRRHRSLHVSARTEDEAVRKASAYFKKALASRDNKLVGEIKTDRITVFGNYDYAVYYRLWLRYCICRRICMAVLIVREETIK